MVGGTARPGALPPVGPAAITAQARPVSCRAAAPVDATPESSAHSTGAPWRAVLATGRRRARRPATDALSAGPPRAGDPADSRSPGPRCRTAHEGPAR